MCWYAALPFYKHFYPHFLEHAKGLWHGRGRRLVLASCSFVSWYLAMHCAKKKVGLGHLFFHCKPARLSTLVWTASIQIPYYFYRPLGWHTLKKHANASGVNGSLCGMNKGPFNKELTLTPSHPAYSTMTAGWWFSHPDWASYDILSERSAQWCNLRSPAIDQCTG